MTSLRPAQGRQLNIGVTFLAWLNIYQTLKQIVQDAVAPEIQGLKGEIQGIKGEIKAQIVHDRAFPLWERARSASPIGRSLKKGRESRDSNRLATPPGAAHGLSQSERAAKG